MQRVPQLLIVREVLLGPHRRVKRLRHLLQVLVQLGWCLGVGRGENGGAGERAARGERVDGQQRQRRGEHRRHQRGRTPVAHHGARAVRDDVEVARAERAGERPRVEVRLGKQPQVAIDQPVRTHVAAAEHPRVGRVGLEADRLDT